jgi:two-component system, NtrC family, response regulator HydG
MRASDLALEALLEFQPERGKVRFAGQRALILDAVALGILRKELVATFGVNAARSVLTRFGFAHGWRMAEALRDAFPWESHEDWRRAGGFINRLQGLFLVQPESRGPLSEQGSILSSSYEAEQHLLHFGRAEHPVCWSIAGLASGYLSRTEGKDLFILEDRCIGKGDAMCRLVGRTAEAWGDALAEHLPFFKEGGLDDRLHGVTEDLKRIEREIRRKRRALGQASAEEPSGLVARSAAMREVVDLAKRVAAVDSTVLLTGESGVGKERIARLIHEESARAAGPFIAINCGAVPEALLESELFGHTRGAFTGATQDRPGLFEAAHAGTLFLDEIGETPAAMQVKLLRALQEREIRRIGESRSRPVDARIISATNRDLSPATAGERFRPDLYYRLRVVEIRLSPLRERKEEILPFARLFLAEAARRMKRPPRGLSPSAGEALLRHSWPGNVRELENAMERAAALARGEQVELGDLPEELRQAERLAAPDVGLVRPLKEVERDYILAALAQNGGNQAKTASQLGIGVVTLYRKLKQYAASPPSSGGR